MKKLFVSLMVILMVITSVSASATKEAKAEEKVVTVLQDANLAEAEWYRQMNADFEAETGIHVDAQFAASTGNEFMQKLNIDLMAGSNVDIVISSTLTYFKAQLDSGFLAPLSSVIKDAEKTWGGSLAYGDDGDIYGIPTKQEIYVLFYNKDIFDNAGVEYPHSQMTWEEVIELAKKVTNPSKGIYGFYFDRYGAPWGFLPARQADVAVYNAEGKSNFADPAFAEAISMIYNLDKQAISMPYPEVVAGSASWNYYAIVGNKCAMYPSLNFFTRELNNAENYNIDWRYGVCALPSTGDSYDLTNISYVSINANAEHPNAAATYVEWVGKNQWKYEKSGIPALAQLTDAEKDLALASIAEGSHGSVTVDELYDAYFNSGRSKSTSADFTGVASTAYYNIITEEVRNYHLGTTASLEECINKIISRANEAIANAQ